MHYYYDVFIAYHGTFSRDGSYIKAQGIKKNLEEHGIKAYIFTESDGEDWPKVLRHIKESKTMLVVLNSSVLRDELGRIRVKNKDGKPYQLYEEIEQFRILFNESVKSLQTINFVYVGEDKATTDARNFCLELVPEICPKLNNLLAADYTCDKILVWVKSAMKIQEEFDTKKGKEFDKNDLTINDIVDTLIEDLLRRNCAIVLGPLINDNYKLFPGEGNTFFEKCRSMNRTKGAIVVSRAIEDFSYNQSSSIIKHLAKLPFTCYITTVEHTKILDALRQSGKTGVTMSSEEAAYGLDLQKGNIPVFELKRSSVYNDDCVLPEGSLYNLLHMLLTAHKILYVGYDENYEGYKAISLALKELLGDDYVPVNNIVAIDNQNGSEIEDTEFCRYVSLSSEDLIGRLTTNKSFSKSFRYDEADSPFITELFNIASTPTETQAIELFLQQLSTDCDSAMSFDEIINKADSNCQHLLQIKGNFNAFAKCWELIKGDLGPQADKRILKRTVNSLQRERQRITDCIQDQGEEYSRTESPQRILLFSESLRVVEFLTGMLKEFQERSCLYVCECRPKSETPFHDAKNMCEMINNKRCAFKEITIIPDMAAFNLLARGMIDTVILGAHDIVFFENNPVYFINTCGSSALTEIAFYNNVNVIVVAESGKINNIDPEDKSSDDDCYTYYISYGHESTIYDDYEFTLWTDQNNVKTRNIGYDFCKFHKGMKLICEDKVYEAVESTIKIRLVDRTND